MICQESFKRSVPRGVAPGRSHRPSRPSHLSHPYIRDSLKNRLLDNKHVGHRGNFRMTFSTKSSMKLAALLGCTVTVDGCPAVFLIPSFSSRIFFTSLLKTLAARQISMKSFSFLISAKSSLAVTALTFQFFLANSTLKSDSLCAKTYSYRWSITTIQVMTMAARGALARRHRRASSRKVLASGRVTFFRR